MEFTLRPSPSSLPLPLPSHQLSSPESLSPYGLRSSFSSDRPIFPGLYDEIGVGELAGLTSTPGNGGGQAGGESCGVGEQAGGGFAGALFTPLAGEETTLSAPAPDGSAGVSGAAAKPAGLRVGVGGVGTGDDGTGKQGLLFSFAVKGSEGDELAALLELPSGVGLLGGCTGGGTAASGGGDAATASRAEMSGVAPGERGAGLDGSRVGDRLPIGVVGGGAAATAQVRSLSSTRNAAAGAPRVGETSGAVSGEEPRHGERRRRVPCVLLRKKKQRRMIKRSSCFKVDSGSPCRERTAAICWILLPITLVWGLCHRSYVVPPPVSFAIDFDGFHAVLSGLLRVEEGYPLGQHTAWVLSCILTLHRASNQVALFTCPGACVRTRVPVTPALDTSTARPWYPGTS